MAVSSGAHVVFDRTTLRQYVQHSAATLHVEFVKGPVVWVAPDGADRQEYFRVRPLEALRGSAPNAAFDFFPHAEGFPAFAAGDRTLLFLERTAERPEFASLADRFPFYSVQGRGDEWRLAGFDGDTALGLAREYVAWLEAGPNATAAGLRRLLLAGLGSSSEALQADAIAELIHVRDATGLLDDVEAVAPFATLVGSKNLSIGRRVALLHLLEGRPGFEADAAWLALTASEHPPEDLRFLVRAAGSSRDPRVGRWVASHLTSPDATLRWKAVQGLAHSWHGAHAAALATALEDPDPRVARSAVRALGAIGDEAARRALDAAAVGEGPVARWAAAELRRKH